MRKIVSIFSITVASFFLLVSTAVAQIYDFQGQWVNIDPDTGGITKIVIGVEEANVTVRAWGKCIPKDCDWGLVNATAYVSAPYGKAARALTAVFGRSYHKTLLIIHYPQNNQVRIESYIEYAASDGRSNYANVYVMKRF